MKVQIDNLLDEKNKMLWFKLQEQCTINVEYHSYSWYSVYSQNDTHTVYVPLGEALGCAAFAHELLHIEIRNKEMELPAGIKYLIWGSPSITMCFTDDLIAHMINCFNHIKMLPEFLKLGYRPDEFISDYLENKFTDFEAYNIVSNYYNKATDIYNSVAIDYYIGKYIAVKACPNTSFNYSKNLQSLNDLDSNLFTVLEKFHSEWSAYDKATASIVVDPHSIASDFIENMEKWSNGKVIL
jgi:hypothetical protein